MPSEIFKLRTRRRFDGANQAELARQTQELERAVEEAISSLLDYVRELEQRIAALESP